MTNYPYDLWLSVGSDAGISFASVGELARDSSMMQGILLSLQSLMTTEVNVSDSQFMTGQNEFVRFGTFTMNSDEETKIIVQYIVKSDSANKISIEDENIVQELSLSFGKFIMLTPNFYDNVEAGRTISPDYISKSFINACTITKQKANIKDSNRPLQKDIEEELKKAYNNPDNYPTLLQLKNLENWLKEEKVWEKGALNTFKRQLIIQMFAQDILNNIVRTDPFAVLQFKQPRYANDEVVNKIEEFLRNQHIKVNDIIENQLKKKLDKYSAELYKKLTISQIHTAETFIANSISKEIVINLAKENPILGLLDFRQIKLYRTILGMISEYISHGTQGDIICDALLEDFSPLIIQGARLFFNQLIHSFKGKELPVSIWNAITDFTFSIISEKMLPPPDKKGKTVKSLISLKKEFIADKINKLTSIDKKWKKELIQIFSKAGLGEKIAISNIEESVLLAKSLERAIISTLQKIVEDQFFNSSLGAVFRYIINTYKEIVPIYTFSTILNKIVDDIRVHNLQETAELSITTHDLIGGAINNGFIRAYVKSVPVTYKKRLFGRSQLKFDGQVISVNELLMKPGLNVQYFNTVYSLDDLEKNAEILTACLINPKILLSSYEISVIRKMMSSYSDRIFKFESDIIAQLDNIITLLQKEKVSSLNNANLIPELRNNFPSFPKIDNIPERFKNKHYHETCREIWDKHIGKIHRVIQELLSSFANMRSNDLHYREKAIKLYDRAVKELKKQRKSLSSSWNSVNNKITAEIRKWAAGKISNVNSHIEFVHRKHLTWLDDSFYIRKLQPHNFTPSIEECLAKTQKKRDTIKDEIMSELPKNFVEIALSILLYHRIPDYVIDDSYNQMIQNASNASLSVKKAWIKSKSRKEFENNLYINMRILGNTLLKIINTYMRMIHQSFIKKDLELSNDRQGFFIELGRLPKEIYKMKVEVNSIYRFPNIKVVSSGKDWLVKYYIEPDYYKKMTKYQDHLVVISDLVQFVAREKFNDNTEQLIDGIKAMTNYLIEHGDKRVIDLIETLKESIFRLSDYPSISAVDKHDE